MEKTQQEKNNIYTIVAVLAVSIGILIGASVGDMEVSSRNQQSASLDSDFADLALQIKDSKTGWQPVGQTTNLDKQQTLELKKLLAPLQEFSARVSPDVNTGQGNPNGLTYYTCYWFNDQGQGQSQTYSTNDNTGGAVYFIEGGACMPS